MRIIFLRHGLTVPPTWKFLAPSVKEEIEQLIETGIFDGIEAIYASAERKAIETAIPIADHLNLNITTESAFNELDRGKQWIQTQEDYESIVSKCLGDRSKSACGWESGEAAFNRFMDGIDHITQQTSQDFILVVSHGLVLTLFFASLLNKEEDMFERWHNLKFLSTGIVENGEVIKDIV